MGDALSTLFGGGSGSGTSANAGGGDGSASGANPFSDFMSALSGAAGNTLSSPANAAEAPFPQTQIDPSVGASLAINPPVPPTTDQTGAQPAPAAQKTQPAPQGQQYAPDSAVAALKRAFQQIAAGRKNPYQLAGPQVPPGAVPPGTGAAVAGAGDIPVSPQAVPPGVGYDPNNPPLPPPRPSIVGDPAEARTPPAGQEAPAPSPGRDITVHKAGAGPAAVSTPPGTADESVPTKKDQPQPQPQPGPIMRDVTGGQSLPQLLPELAQIAAAVLPMLLGGGRGHGFFHHGGRGHWPYFAPGRGWQMHGYHPGPPWMPMHPRHMNALGFGPGMGGDDPFSHIMRALLGVPEDGQGGGRQDGGRPDTPSSGNEGWVKSGNQFTDALTSIESPHGNVVSQSDKDSRGLTLRQGGDPTEISNGYFQIQNYRRGGTWGHYSRLAGVNKPTPMSASYEEQHKVARLIPIREWGGQTRRALHAKFGTFDESLTLGQLEDWKAGGGQPKTARREQPPDRMYLPPQPETTAQSAYNG